MKLDRAYLEHIAPQIRGFVLQTHRPESCIYTTAVAVATLRALGADAYALSVKAHVYGPDGHGIGVGYPPETGELPAGMWAGHLVAICDRRWLCDWSIDQANRPEHGIEIPPLVLGPLEESFLRGRQTFGCDGPGGQRIEYRAQSQDKSWRVAPDWARGIGAEITIDRTNVSIAQGPRSRA